MASKSKKQLLQQSQKLLLPLGIFVMCVASALAVIYSQHQHRLMFAKLESLNHERDQLQVEWSQLLLEQSTLTGHGRIEKLARSKLGMSFPDANAIKRIK